MLSGAQLRTAHLGRCLTTGVDHVGSISQYHRVVGLTIVGAVFVGPLAGGVVAASFGLAQALLPSTLFALVLLAGVIFDGAYIEHQKAEESYPKLGDLAVEGECRSVMIMEDDKGGEFYLVPSVTLINHEPRRVVLRVRVKVDTTDGGFARLAPSDKCFETGSLREVYWTVGELMDGTEPHGRTELRHLPSSVVLEPNDVTTGHVEFHPVPEGKTKRPLDKDDPQEIGPIVEVIDLLSKRYRQIWS